MPSKATTMARAAAASTFMQFIRRLGPQMPPQVLAEIFGSIIEEWAINCERHELKKEEYHDYLKKLGAGEITLDQLTISDDDVLMKEHAVRPSQRGKSTKKEEEKNGHSTAKLPAAPVLDSNPS